MLKLINGKIWTGCSTSTWCESVAITGNKIYATGSSSEILSLPCDECEVIDLKGHLVLPGFIDNHTHFLMGGFQLLHIDLRDAKNHEEFAQKIQARAVSLKPGSWLLGGNWDHECWENPLLPTKGLIDHFTAEIPVFLTRIDLHMGIANSAALNLAGITKDTLSPDGGEIVRNPFTGEATGILKDKAMDLVRSKIPVPSKSDYKDALKTAMKHAASVGVTSVQDITDWTDLDIIKEFYDNHALTVRMSCRLPITDWQKVKKVANSFPESDFLKLSGLKGFVDGSIGSSTALFFEPYTDAPATCGLLAEQMIPLEKMQSSMLHADKADLQLSLHAIGDKANHILIDLYDQVEKTNGKKDRRLRIEHAQHLNPEDIMEMKQLDIIASMQPSQAYDDGCWAEKRLGLARCKTAYSLRTLLDTGVKVSFGTDWPVVPLTPMLGIYTAVTRQTKDNRFADGWIPEQKITIEEAIRAYTIDSAYGDFSETVKGSIEPEKLADLVIVSNDLFTINPNQIKDTYVLCTISDGKVIYQHAHWK